MSGRFSTELMEKLPVVGILRGLAPERLRGVVEACRDGGLSNLEVTMNSPDAAGQIRRAGEMAGGAMNVGAGTVTSLTLLEEALEAGASFIVTPTLALPVIERCVELSVPVFPGAFSPGEVERAWEMGATMVKVFPAESLGPNYIRNLKGPFPNIRLMPTGGVDLGTIQDYCRAGADGFGVGSPLFRKERIEAEDWEWVREQCRSFVRVYGAFAARRFGASS